MDNQETRLSTDSSKTTTDRAQEAIKDLWGVMIALFGVRWSSQFGETPDSTGQWRQTLSGISRRQIADALNEIRLSGRAWPPTAPEFRSMCLGSTKHKTTEAAYAEVHGYITGRITADQLSDAVRHTIYRNMDFYQFKTLSLEKQQDTFKFAYRATIEQLNAGDDVYQPPKPIALIDEFKEVVSAEDAEKARLDLLAMFEDESQPKPLTRAELDDLARLERLK